MCHCLDNFSLCDLNNEENLVQTNFVLEKIDIMSRSDTSAPLL